MAFYNKRTFTTPGRSEILHGAAGLDIVMPCILDAASIPADGNGDRILPAGTIIARDTAVAGGSQWVPYTAAGTQTIKGVLAYDVAVPDGTAASDAQAALFYHAVSFRQDRIVNYGTHATALKAALYTCVFE